MKIAVEDINTREVIGEFEADDYLEANCYDSELEAVLSDLSSEPIGAEVEFEEVKITRIDEDDIFSEDEN